MGPENGKAGVLTSEGEFQGPTCSCCIRPLWLTFSPTLAFHLLCPAGPSALGELSPPPPIPTPFP